MILAYHLATTTGNATFSRNERYLNKVIEKKVIGVVTTFSVAECVGVFGEAYAERDGVAPTTDQLEAARQRIERFIRAAGIEKQDSDALSHSVEGPVNVFSRALQIELATRPTRGRDGEWRTVGGADALHLVFAERADCEQFATFDQGFQNAPPPVKIVMVQEA
jgi:predicted nucleic acid-binding protein